MCQKFIAHDDGYTFAHNGKPEESEFIAYAVIHLPMPVGIGHRAIKPTNVFK